MSSLLYSQKNSRLDDFMKQSIVLMLLSFAMFTACDDSSSGAGPDPVAEVSSSSGDEAISSSSVTDKGTSSGGSLVSSSDILSSSSKKETVKSSSSVLLESSSSVSIADQKIPCDMPEHGIYHIGNEEFVCKTVFLSLMYRHLVPLRRFCHLKKNLK